MEQMLKNLGFTRAKTQVGMFYYGYLQNGSCLEIKVNDVVDVIYVSGLNHCAKLTQFNKDINLKFFEEYINKLVSALGD